MDVEILKSILIAAGLGFMIGIQRAIHHLRREEHSFAGSRTFSLISIVGYVSGLLNKQLPGIALVAALIIGFMALLAYFFKGSQHGRTDSNGMDLGSTTHFAAIATFLLGLLVSVGLAKYAIMTGIVIVVLLEIKPKLQRVEAKITSSDVNAAILLLAMTFVVLPILPNRMIGPYHLFNPYKTWLMAVIISALSFVGYAAIKIFGHKKGLFLTGALGGMVSSTAVSVSMSKIALANRAVTIPAATAISVACTFMFFRVLVLVLMVNPDLSIKMVFPFLGATISGLLFTYYLYKHTKAAPVDVEGSISKNPLQLSEAIKFGILFGVVYGASSFVQSRYGDLGVYVISFLSGLTDVDAITLSLAELAKDGRVSAMVSLNGIIIASVVNSLIKLGIASWIGGAGLGRHLVKYFAVTLGMLIVCLVFFK